MFTWTCPTCGRTGEWETVIRENFVDRGLKQEDMYPVHLDPSGELCFMDLLALDLEIDAENEAAVDEAERMMRDWR